MVKLLKLKQIQWVKDKGVLTTSSPSHRYVIRNDSYTGMVIVNYHNLHTNSADNTQFKTVLDAMEWVEKTHIPSKLREWFSEVDAILQEDVPTFTVVAVRYVYASLREREDRLDFGYHVGDSEDVNMVSLPMNMWDEDMSTTDNVKAVFKRLDPTAKVVFKGNSVSPASISGLILKCKKGL